MATSRLVLPFPGGSPPDASGAGNNPATPARVVSSGTQTTNTPKASYWSLLFDQSTDEHWEWAFPLPADYVSGGTLKLYWGAVPTSGNVIWKAGVVMGEPSSEDLDASVFVAADATAATAVPGTAGQFKETSITLTMTGADVSGGADFVILFIGRDADNGSDTAAGDAFLVGAVLEYTS